MSFSAEMLKEAAADVAAGVAEEPLGSNDGPIVRQYLEAVGVSAPNNWCAAGVSAWVRRAAKTLGVKPPIQSAGAKDLGEQLRKLGVWHETPALLADSTKLKPGSVILWKSKIDPDSWRGHVGIIEFVKDDQIHTIEANAGVPLGVRVARMVHPIKDPMLLGAGNLDDIGLDVQEPSRLWYGFGILAAVGGFFFGRKAARRFG